MTSSPAAPETTAGSSPGRGSIRQALDAGLHPATQLPLATCGECIHLQRKVLADQSARSKCGLLVGVGRRNGGPDLRSSTPACSDFMRKATARRTAASAHADAAN
ncbi:hypothetical protein SMD44_p10227 (plasmid) [Streptomyces alboflavus]|uniref:Uncharacterized protein n=1 Tax=Streptomyces alboflavus TaxID=67267 RepID=A0A291W4Z7_9ACTN|nr:hypothetical protein SMD44_p10227 [Streptomyces alboflavus]